LTVRTTYNKDRGCGSVALEIHNRGFARSKVRTTDAYTRQRLVQTLEPGETVRQSWPLAGSFGRDDPTLTVEGDHDFKQQLAGHVETGADSMTDPALGANG